MDAEYVKYWLVALAVIAFNIPIAVAAWKFRNISGLSEVIDDGGAIRAVEKDRSGGALNAILQEKAPDGTPSGALSYSRVTGLIGAVVVASLFWVMSNVAIAVAILNPGDLENVLGGVSKLFFVGAALFIPYAFNQIKTLIQ